MVVTLPRASSGGVRVGVTGWRSANNSSSGEGGPVWISPGVHISNHAAGDGGRSRCLWWCRFSLQELDKQLGK